MVGGNYKLGKYIISCLLNVLNSYKIYNVLDMNSE